MIVALLAVAMLLSLAAPAFAGVQVNPDECPFCGIGTIYSESTTQSIYNTGNYRVCDCGGKVHTEQQKSMEWTVHRKCTNPNCHGSFDSFLHKELFWDKCLYGE